VFPALRDESKTSRIDRSGSSFCEDEICEEKNVKIDEEKNFLMNSPVNVILESCFDRKNSRDTFDFAILAGIL
jgi:hypothetical protein